METLVEMGIDSVCLVALKDGKVEINRILPVALVDGLDGLNTLDEKIEPDMV
jgi:hypothetical protein